MRTQINLNDGWAFHLDELAQRPNEIAKKAYAFGGITESLPQEGQDRLPVSPGGRHFLRLIAQGDEEIGLRNLCNTDLNTELDDSWKTVNVPHDWKVELPYEDNFLNLMAGSKPDGVAYYRKRFAIKREYEGQKLLLHFDGVARMADVWLNGAYLGHNNSGYTEFDFDISGLAYYEDEGLNTVLVKADTSRGQEGWWYEGAGIYKDVSLRILPQVSLAADDFYVYTQELTENEARLGYEFSLENATAQAVTKTVQVSVADFQTEVTLEVPAHGQVSHHGEFTLNDVQTWSPETPHLYQASLKINEDQITKNFGVRTFAYDQNGFYLNGQSYELHGICEHQDFAGVGVALNQDIVDFKVKVMKNMGVNAWRSAHHFASKELLDACDRLGVLVMNENRLPEATPWRLEDMAKMVKKSRMNASIAFWSLGNEELVGNTEFGKRSIGKFAEVVRRLDQEHLIVSAELLSPEGFVDDDYLTNFDILGINYPEAGVMGAGGELIKQSHPDLPMMSTENASYFSTRGIYKDNGEACQCNNFGSMYSMVLPGKRQPGDPGVGGTAHPEEVMAYLKSHQYMGGVFLWTGFDYFGEPSPFGWPGIGSQFGIADVCGFPKDYYYYYKAHWTKEAFVHVMPHWNEAGLELDENGKTKVRAFSNQASLKLFVNGQSQGKQAVVDASANWEVTYVSGQIEVKAYDAAGNEVAHDVRQTAGVSTELATSVLYQGQDYDLVAVQAVDEAGREVPMENKEISISITNGQVIGLGNGDPADTSDFSLDKIKLFSGKALIIVRKDSATEYQVEVK